MLRNITMALCFLVLACKGNSQEKETVNSTQKTSEKEFDVTKSEAEWKKELTDMQFYVLRKEANQPVVIKVVRARKNSAQ